MTIDLYSKSVLTIIAIALAAVAIQGFMPPAIAQGKGACGEDALTACYITLADRGIDISGSVVTVTGSVFINGTTSGRPLPVLAMN